MDTIELTLQYETLTISNGIRNINNNLYNLFLTSRTQYYIVTDINCNTMKLLTHQNDINTTKFNTPTNKISKV